LLLSSGAPAAATGLLGNTGTGRSLLLGLAVLHTSYAVLASLLKPYSHALVGCVQQATNWMLAVVFVLIYLAHQSSDAEYGVGSHAAAPEASIAPQTLYLSLPLNAASHMPPDPT
jgi:hypothetical protein